MATPSGRVAVVGLAIGILVAPGLGAQVLAMGPLVFTEADEYATTQRHDPFDYAELSDFMRDDGVVSGVEFPPEMVSGPTVARWTARPEDGGEWHVSPVWMTWPHDDPTDDAVPDRDPGALPDQYDGMTLPIDADRFDGLSMRIFASAPAEIRLDWFACQESLPECLGGLSFELTAGWNSVQVPLVLDPDHGPDRPWEGQILGLRLSGRVTQETEFDLDWFRIYERQDTFEIASETGFPAWDSDDDLGNNTDQLTTAEWGPLPLVPGSEPGLFQVDPGAYPPGTYRLVEDSSVLGEFTIIPSPRPVVLQPDRQGGEDFATAVLGNPWDFSDVDDVVAIRNAINVAWDGGMLAGTNGSNDPYIVLPTGPDGLDSQHYHRVTVRQSYDGPFNLDDSVQGGLGGTHGRLIWRTSRHPASGPAQYSDGREFVYYKEWDEYTYDMASGPLQGSAAEPGDVAWDAGPVTYLRYDPNEAPSAYRWYLDDLRIAADDAAAPTFDITWIDEQHEPGTTARVVLDTDAAGYDGEVIFDGPQVVGLNKVTFDATGRLPGAYWVHVTSTAPDGRQGQDYSTGPVQVDPRIAGTNRFETAVELSRQTFERARTVVVASASNFPDALAAAQVAAVYEGPLLLTPSTRLHEMVAEELQRLGAERVILAGGTAALNEDVSTSLTQAGFEVERIGGTDRYETAVRLAQHAASRRGGSVSQVIVAVGTTFPDALAAGPWAAFADAPLVLSHPSQAPEAVRDAIRVFDPDVVRIVGGTAAIPDEVVAELVGEVPWERLAGKDRYETARALADAAIESGASPADVLIATGRSFPDALAAGPSAVARGGLLLLADPKVLPAPTRTLLQGQADQAWDGWRVIGGSAALSHARVRELRSASGL